MKITLEIDDTRFEEKPISAIAREVVAGLSDRYDSQNCNCVLLNNTRKCNKLRCKS